MDWIDRLKAAMAYIEDNLEGDIDWDQAARLALCSSHQFMRTFALITGVPLSDYVRRRRLTKAAFDLQTRQEKVLDVALRYGYASPTAFQRAFTIFHGVTPVKARRPGVTLKSYPPMSFQLTIQGGIDLQYRIEEKPALRLVGYREDISMLGGENFARIPKMWEEFPHERVEALGGLAGAQYPGMFGVIAMVEGKSDMLAYYIAVASERTDLQGWMSEITNPPLTYAVFDTPLATIQDTTRRIFAEWLPHAGYEHADAAELEYYPDGDMSDETKYICEIWIPVVKK